MHYPQIRQTTG